MSTAAFSRAAVGFLVLLACWQAQVARSQWVQTQLPTDTKAADNWFFGSSIAVSGNVVAVGSPNSNVFNDVSEYYNDGSVGTYNEGYVSIYECSGSACTFQQRITQADDVNDGTESSNQFGAAVAMASGLLVIGAPGFGGQNGASDSPFAGYVEFHNCPSAVPVACTYFYEMDGFTSSSHNGMMGMSTAVIQMTSSQMLAFVGMPLYSNDGAFENSFGNKADCTSGPCGLVIIYDFTGSYGDWTLSSYSYMFYEHSYWLGMSVAFAPVASVTNGFIFLSGDTKSNQIWTTFCVYPDCYGPSTLTPVPGPTSGAKTVGYYNSLFATSTFIGVSYYDYVNSQGAVCISTYSCPSSNNAQCTITLASTLTPAFLSLDQSNNYGFSVTAYSTYVVVAATNLFPIEVYVYNCATPTACTLLSIVPNAVVPGVTSTGQGLGYFVATGANFVAVGAPMVNGSTGAVFLYSCGSGTFPSCTVTAPATSPVTTTAASLVDSTVGADYYFSTSVAAAGTIIYVGSAGWDMHGQGASGSIKGAFSVYSCGPPTSTALCASTAAQRYNNGANSASKDLFGASLAAASSGNVNALVVGAPGYSTNKGAISVYSCAISSPFACTYITQTVGAASSWLGWSTSASYSSASAGFYLFGGAPATKKFYVYFCAASATATSIPSCTASASYASSQTSARFGQALTSVGSMVVVGDPNDRFATTWGCTTAPACTEHTTSIVVPPSGTGFLNMSMSISSLGSMLAIGAPQSFGYRGAFYVYACTTPTPSCSASPFYTFQNTAGSMNDQFGQSVSFAGSLLAVSAPGQMLVYMYQCTTTTCTMSGPAVPQSTQTGVSATSEFGYSIALSQNVDFLAVSNAAGEPSTNANQGNLIVVSCVQYWDAILPLCVPTPTASATASRSASATQSQTVTLSATATQTVTQSATQSQTVTQSATATLTLTQSPTRSATPSMTASVTGSITQSATASPTASYTQSATGSYTQSATGSGTQSATGSDTQSATGSDTQSATQSATGSATGSATFSGTESLTESATASETASATASFTESATESLTESATESFTESFTNSATESFTESSTNSATESFTESFTNSYTVSFTHTPSPTQSYTRSFTHSATTNLHLTFTTYSESATESFTESATASFTESSTLTRSYSASQTASHTRSDTASKTHSETASPTASATASDTASKTRSETASPTASATASDTASKTHSDTASKTRSDTASATATASATESATPSAPITVYIPVTNSFATSTAREEILTTSAAVAPTATAPSANPSSAEPTVNPSATPSAAPSATESATESATPSATPSASPSAAAPTVNPSAEPPNATPSSTPTTVPSSTMFYYNTHLPTGPGQQPQVTLVFNDGGSRRRSGFIIVVNATLVACSDPGFFVSDFDLPYWLNRTDMAQLAMQFSSLNTTTGLTDYVDGPSCDPSTPDNYYVGIVPLPGQVSLLSSPNGCNGSVTADFGTKQ